MGEMNTLNSIFPCLISSETQREFLIISTVAKPAVVEPFC